MKTKARRTGVAPSAVPERTDPRATDSSQGSAIVTPRPRSTARREIPLFMAQSPTAAGAERFAQDNGFDQSLHPVPVCTCSHRDGADRGAVEGLHAAPEGVREDLRRESLDKLVAAPEDLLLDVVRAVDLDAPRKHAAGIDRPAVLGVAPAPDGVEMLQREAERIEPVVARSAAGDRDVSGKLLANRCVGPGAVRLLERRDIRRRGR